MTPAELQEVLRLHGLWLAGDSEGRRANLSGADLDGANLDGASLEGANLREANLREANLRWTSLEGANLRLAQGLPIVADAPARLQAVAVQVLGQPDSLRMDGWHSDCGTAHCLAGWAIHQAGPIGATLESLHGSHLAGLFLLGHDAADRFYQSNEDVLEWLRSISEVQS